jgi:hypothetical protein
MTIGYVFRLSPHTDFFAVAPSAMTSPSAPQPQTSVSAFGTVMIGVAPRELPLMTQRFAEGLNYSIDLDGAIATCRVWSRPDLDSATGAQMAIEKIALFQRLASKLAAGMVFDLTQAPAVTGPKTQEALGQMMKAWQDAAKPVAIVVSSNSMQWLQLRRLVSMFTPDHGALFGSVEEASAWLESRLPGP